MSSWKSHKSTCTGVKNDWILLHSREHLVVPIIGKTRNRKGGWLWHIPRQEWLGPGRRQQARPSHRCCLSHYHPSCSTCLVSNCESVAFHTSFTFVRKVTKVPHQHQRRFSRILLKNQSVPLVFKCHPDPYHDG